MKAWKASVLHVLELEIGLGLKTSVSSRTLSHFCSVLSCLVEDTLITLKIT